MINIAEKMEMEDRLLGNLARWMISHGTVLSDREQSNEYVGIRMVEVVWKGRNYRIIQVDGSTCRIEKF